jgi:hypothetical protein
MEGVPEGKAEEGLPTCEVAFLLWGQRSLSDFYSTSIVKKMK